MNAPKRSPLLAVLLLLFVHGSISAKTPPPDHWVGTWATAPFAAPNDAGKYGVADMTYREIVHVSVGGPLLRVVLNNEFLPGGWRSAIRRR